MKWGREGGVERSPPVFCGVEADRAGASESVTRWRPAATRAVGSQARRRRSPRQRLPTRVSGGRVDLEGSRKRARAVPPVYRGVDERTNGTPRKPTLTMATVKALLNHAQPIPGFVYQRIDFAPDGSGRLDVKIRAHEQIRARCSHCQRPCPGYDHLPARRWSQVPLWNIRCHYYYVPRRVECPEHGIVVEHLPWSQGKRPWTMGMMAFLAMWARRMSWRETAQAFQVSWESVFRSVEWAVE